MGTTRKSRSRQQRASLRLDVAFYSSTAVKKAQRAFSHLANIKLRRAGKVHLVEFGSLDSGVAEELPDEFANYALSCVVVEQ